MKMSVMRRLAGLLSVAIALGALPVGAEPRADKERSTAARQAFEDGKKAYNVGDFDRAIELWKQAYEYRDDPIFLYNIAQAYRQKGDAQKAIFFYRAYTRESPRARNRAEVEARIVELQKILDAQPPPEPPKPEPEPAPPAPPPPAPVVAAEVPEPPPPDEHPGQSLVVGGWITGGAGAAVLATGIVFALKARSISDDLEAQNKAGVPWTPALRDRESDGQRDSTIGVVGITVGAAAVVTGATLVWLGMKKNAVRHELGWRLVPEGAGLRLSASF